MEEGYRNTTHKEQNQEGKGH